MTAAARALIRRRLPWLDEDGDAKEPVRVHLERRAINCGKKGCPRCASGRLHGPYTYIRFAPDVFTSRRRIYVPVALHRSIRAALRRFHRVRADRRRAMNYVLRLCK